MRRDGFGIIEYCFWGLSELVKKVADCDCDLKSHRGFEIPVALATPKDQFLLLVILSGYSIFDSALYRSLKLKWILHQEKATLHDLTMATCESKML
jgi:hypothetical protein